jgi:hypothetical protein
LKVLLELEWDILDTWLLIFPFSKLFISSRATSIFSFARTLSRIFPFHSNGKKREELNRILEDLQAKGYMLLEAHYKHLPLGFNKEDKYVYLAKYRAMYMFKTYAPNKKFTSKNIIDVNFSIYEDMLSLQQWVYKLTLKS